MLIYLFILNKYQEIRNLIISMTFIKIYFHHFITADNLSLKYNDCDILHTLGKVLICPAEIVISPL